VFTAARHWSLSWPTCFHSTPSRPISLKSILIFSHIYAKVFRVVSSRQDFQPKYENLKWIYSFTKVCTFKREDTSDFGKSLTRTRECLRTFANNFAVYVKFGNDWSRNHPCTYSTYRGTAIEILRGDIWTPPRIPSYPMGEADHSPPSSAEVKNAWSYSSTPPIHLHVVVLN
jgi:hypothetical protein